jgi:hypothetical protein
MQIFKSDKISLPLFKTSHPIVKFDKGGSLDQGQSFVI